VGWEFTRVLVNGTCIEGGVLPIMALKSLMGSPSPEYYHSKKTITLNVVDLTPQDELRLNHAMPALVYIVKHRGMAAIRVSINTTAKNIYQMDWVRMVSVDYIIIGKLGVDMVESTYRAMDWFQRAPITNQTVSSYNNTNSMMALNDLVHKADSITKNDNMDELIFKLFELESLDADKIGRLAGDELGYQNGAITKKIDKM